MFFESENKGLTESKIRENELLTERISSLKNKKENLLKEQQELKENLEVHHEKNDKMDIGVLNKINTISTRVKRIDELCSEASAERYYF